MKRLQQIIFAAALAACFASAVHTARAQPSLSGSGLLRAERCAGRYECCEDGAGGPVGYHQLAHTTSSLNVSYPPECPLRDVKALTLIEDRGAGGDVPSEELAEAAPVLFSACQSCYAGQIA